METRLGFCVLLLSACAEKNVVRLEFLQPAIQHAREQGGYTCAPRDLAAAEAHVDFAKMEFASGELIGARRELVFADQSVKKLYQALRACSSR